MNEKTIKYYIALAKAIATASTEMASDKELRSMYYYDVYSNMLDLDDEELADIAEGLGIELEVIK